MDLFRLLNHASVKDELILAEITDITSELINLYKKTDYLPDKQYIFSKLKEIIQISAERKLERIHTIALRAMIELTTV